MKSPALSLKLGVALWVDEINLNTIIAHNVIMDEINLNTIIAHNVIQSFIVFLFFSRIFSSW